MAQKVFYAVYGKQTKQVLKEFEEKFWQDAQAFKADANKDCVAGVLDTPLFDVGIVYRDDHGRLLSSEPAGLKTEYFNPIV